MTWTGQSAALALAAMLVAAAAGAATRETTDWRRVATAADRARLRNWRSTWTLALAAARRADPAAVTREGALLQPDGALPTPVPPLGTYRCRTFKLGARGSGRNDFASEPPVECVIRTDDGGLGFRQREGTQRSVALIYEAGASRAVLLGSLVLGDESRALRYGRDAGRNLAGFIERVGPRRWRIVLPEPRFEAQLEVIELVPAA